LNTPAVPVGTANVTELPVVVAIVTLAPPLILYVKVYGAIPFVAVKVIVGEAAFTHRAVDPLIVATGKALIVIVAGVE